MPKSVSPYALWWEAAFAFHGACWTVAMRSWRFAAAGPAGALDDPEATRMVVEKWRAANQGAFDAAFYWARWSLNAYSGGAPSAVDVLSAARGAYAVGVRPGYRKARSNARRLTRVR